MPTSLPRRAQGSPPRNTLLACLPAEDLHRLRHSLRTVPIRSKQMLHVHNDEITAIYFLNGGVASVTAVTTEGEMVEVATIGREGVVGVQVFFGATHAIGTTMMQVPDTDAEMMSSEAFLSEMDRRGALYDCVRSYVQGYLTLTMQSTACIAVHAVHERCARWLLMTHDRVDGDTFILSHEFLAMMLGATRPTVSVVAATLQKAGLITYIHGRITVVDRPGLEAASCECYATVRAHFDRLGL